MNLRIDASPALQGMTTLCCLVLAMALQGCSPSVGFIAPPEVAFGAAPECAPGLPSAAVIKIVEEAIHALRGNPLDLNAGYQVTLGSDGCDYVFAAIPTGLEAIEGFSMRIDRSGKVKGFPWRCPLGHCPDLCSEKIDAGSCMPELSQQKLFEIVRSAIRVSGGDPSLLESRHDLSVSRQGCDYLVSAASRTTTNHFSLLVNQSGEIKTWPWCCEPAFFVPLTTENH